MSRDVNDLMWSNFFQFSYNSYSEDAARCGYQNSKNPDLSHSPRLRWDDKLWDDLTKQIVAAGGNQVIFSLGDGIRYDSHPEIAVEGAWTPTEMKAEKQRLASLGITLVPKLNFSTGHDLWLGDYHRMVSTPVYYEVCADLIAEVIEIFDHPPLFHLGYDEETWYHQTWYEYVV
ncbi:MAG: Tat pathway signal protein, partial [Chloroflexota bacterium]|nr:Tat pathway signal protein [Chloroflexota bacterium]